MYLFPVGPLFDFDGEFRIEAESVMVYSMLFSVYTGSDDHVRAQNSRYTIV